MIEQTEINKEDVLRSVRIYENDPVLEFELFKGYYVVDWFSSISQSKFFAILKGLNYAIDTLTIIQSKKKYPHKTIDVKLEEMFSIKDNVHYLSIEGKRHAITYSEYKGKKKRLEFASEKKNIALLVYLLNNTSRKKLGDKIQPDLEKVLEGYEE